MVDSNVMYCSEQISVPTELGGILKQFTKAVLLEQPINFNQWAANYFAELAEIPLPFSPEGEYIGPPIESFGDQAPGEPDAAVEPASGGEVETEEAAV